VSWGIRVNWGIHVVPIGEEHNTQGLDCWCCPEWAPDDDEDDRRLERVEAEALLAADQHVVIIHRSERADANDVTGPIPWQPVRPG